MSDKVKPTPLTPEEAAKYRCAVEGDEPPFYIVITTQDDQHSLLGSFPTLESTLSAMGEVVRGDLTGLKAVIKSVIVE